MNALTILQDEAKNDFPRLRGTRVSANVPITESWLNKNISRSSNGVLRSLRLEIQPSNQIVVHFGVVHATAVLDETIDFGESPTLVLRLRSVLIASILRNTVSIPFVRFKGTLVRVDLGAIPYISQNRRFWKHIRVLRLATHPRRLDIRIEIAIH